MRKGKGRVKAAMAMPPVAAAPMAAPGGMAPSAGPMDSAPGMKRGGMVHHADHVKSMHMKHGGGVGCAYKAGGKVGINGVAERGKTKGKTY